MDSAIESAEAAEAVELSLGALNHKERTVAELRAWLLERDVSGEAAEAAVTRLVEAGALDDREFARRFTEDKRNLSGWGSERIREALLERGAPREDVEAALDEGGDPEGEIGRAVDAVAAREYDLADDRGRGRALGFLVRRGFRYETAYEAVRRHAAGA